MPIHKMNLDGGVFFAKQVGYIDHVDARMWASALKKYAKSSDFPIMAVVDMTDVDRLCPTVVKEFTTLIGSVNILGIALVTGDAMASKNSSVISKLGTLNTVRVFSSLDEAQRFSRARLNPTFGALTVQTVMQFRPVYAFG